MKSTGIVRRLDDLGRICIPREILRTHNIKPGDALEIFTDGDAIMLRKYAPGCSICGKVDDLLIIDGISYCNDCAKKIAVAWERGKNGRT